MVSDEEQGLRDLQQRLANLSPKQRALLELRLGGLLNKDADDRIRSYRGTATEFPLSFSQRRLWFVDQMGSAESATYNLFYAIRLRGPLELAALLSALDALLRRQEILRVVFGTGESGP